MYAYVRNNPVTRIDPFGLDGDADAMSECQAQCDADKDVKYNEPRLKACYLCCLNAHGDDRSCAKQKGQACAAAAKKIKIKGED